MSSSKSIWLKGPVSRRSSGIRTERHGPIFERNDTSSSRCKSAILQCWEAPALGTQTNYLAAREHVESYLTDLLCFEIPQLYFADSMHSTSGERSLTRANSFGSKHLWTSLQWAGTSPLDNIQVISGTMNARECLIRATSTFGQKWSDATSAEENPNSRSC